MTGPLRSTELIDCWDPDGPADARGFARADRCDHIHWGWTDDCGWAAHDWVVVGSLARGAS
jgi:hypothetical protein